MKQTLKASWIWTSPTIFISDLHINGGPRDQIIINNIKSLFNVVKEDQPTPPKKPHLQRTAKRLVLLGDIFDFNLAYSHTIYQKHFAFYMCLKELVLQGIEIVVFTGNHDPEASKFLEDTLGVQVVKHAVTVQIYNALVRLEHGDLLEPNFFKRSLCRIVRSSLICRLARLIPANLIWKITSKWGTQEPLQPRDAHQVTRDNNLEIHSLIAEHWPKFKSQGIDYWVFGHFHQALAWSESFNKELDLTNAKQDSDLGLSDNAQVFILGDQVRLYSYLHWDKTGPCLHRF